MSPREKKLCDKIAAAIPNVSFWVKQDGQRFYVHAAWLNPIRVIYPAIARTKFWYVETLVEDEKFDLIAQVKRDIDYSQRQLEPQAHLIAWEDYNGSSR